MRRVTGGRERADSVYAGLQALAGEALSDDWVLVHDAARPCVSAVEIDALLTELRGDPVGGIEVAGIVLHGDGEMLLDGGGARQRRGVEP